MGNIKLSKGGGGVTVDATVVYFCDSKFANWSAYCTDASKDMVVVLENIRSLVDDGKKVRTNDKGVKEVLAQVRVDKKEGSSPVEYIRRNIDAFKRGEYDGPFDDMDRYWDSATNDIAKNCWIPLEDLAGNPPLLKLTNWVDRFPKDRLVQGVQIQIVSCTFQVFLRLEKAKGAAVAVEKAALAAEKLAAVTGPTSASAAAAAAAPVDGGIETAPAAGQSASTSKRVPEALLSLNTNAGVTIRGSWVDGTPPIVSFRALAADKRHYMAMPQTNSESFCIVQRIEGYQSGVDDSKLEQGPSVICERVYSLDRKNYIKVIPGQNGAPETQEAILQFSYNVCQYKGEPPKKTSTSVDPDEFPWILHGHLSGRELGLTGITRQDLWPLYGPTEWQGVLVMSIQAEDARRLDFNQPGKAQSQCWSGKLNTYVRGFFPDMRETLKYAGIKLSDASILKVLYSDVFQRLTSENDDGQKVEVISLHLDKFKTKNRGGPVTAIPNMLHHLGNDEIININECEKNIGHLLDHSDLYVLPYIPIPQDIAQKVTDNMGDYEHVRAYRQDVLKHLRSAPHLVDVLLGFKDAPPLKGRSNLLYSSDEITSLSGVQQALAKDAKKRNEVLPTILAGRNMPKDNSVWAKYNQKQPMTLGFDFQLYMVQRRPDQEPDVRAPKKE